MKTVEITEGNSSGSGRTQEESSVTVRFCFPQIPTWNEGVGNYIVCACARVLANNRTDALAKELLT
jgi:hypothetical protein